MKMLPAAVLAGLAGAMILARPVHADADAASRCAAKLPRQARAIYNASAPRLVKGADGRAVVTEQTRKLVLAGKVDHLKANELATAAAECLILR